MRVRDIFVDRSLGLVRPWVVVVGTALGTALIGFAILIPFSLQYDAEKRQQARILAERRQVLAAACEGAERYADCRFQELDRRGWADPNAPRKRNTTQVVPMPVVIPMGR